MGNVQIVLYLLLGIGAGIVSGLVGIGGGIVIVPALVFLFGFSQHQAQGTTLALLVPPIGLLAAWAYYRQGDVNVPVAALICVGFVAGSYCSAKVAAEIPEALLGKIFGGLLVLVGIKMLLGR